MAVKVRRETLRESRFGRVDAKTLAALREIAGEAHVVTNPADLEPYGQDETEDFLYLPEVGVKPSSTEEVSRILALCFEKNIPVTPRGGGTGLSGGALPVFGGVLISFERMNRILEIDLDNLMAVVEPGVITQTFQEEVEKVGLFYPPDPASKGTCTLGGNVAECAGGPRALKYGTTKDYVYGLEAVLADGSVIRPGGKLLKNVSGYSLTQLLVGSEGTLAVITKIILKLIPLPSFRRTLVTPFNSLEEACQSLTAIFRARIVPCAAEFMERAAIKAAEDKLEKKFPYGNYKALLLIEVDGNDEGVLDREIEKVGDVCLKGGAVDVFVADSRTRQEEMWEMRRSIGEAVKGISIYKEEDTVVPRAQLPSLMRQVKDISRKHEITTICYGHAGDGNIHVNILKAGMPDEKWEQKLPIAIKEIFAEVVRLGGTISGEHGIGWTQKCYLPLACSTVELEVMRKIKQAMDPKGILNPGKLLPE
jgi:glycolate oxidase